MEADGPRSPIPRSPSDGEPLWLQGGRVSQRRGGRVVGQHRSNKRPGWEKAHLVLRREGCVVNHKKLRRLWREESLVRPASAKREVRRPGTVVPFAGPEHPNHVWVIDFQFDEIADRRA